MFMRLLQVRINPDKIFELERTYETVVLPALQGTRGCIYAGLVQSMEDQSDGLSLTLWDRQEDALEYERSGKYAQLIEASRPYFSDTVEWKVQLSDDLNLEYGPVSTEPVVKAYDADLPLGSQKHLEGGHSAQIFVRIVSMRINPEKIHDFIEIYEHEIIPALQQVPGCHDAYLAEGVKGSNEILSITLWESLEHARAYETTGEFDKLKQKIQHTFSNLALWKMGLDNPSATGQDGLAKRVVTSDDVAVRTYSLVMGKAFR